MRFFTSQSHYSRRNVSCSAQGCLCKPRKILMRLSTRQMMWAVCFALPLTVPTIAVAENVGTSQADLPDYAGAFSIENTTGVTIPYSYRWGDKHPWKSMKLAS